MNRREPDADEGRINFERRLQSIAQALMLALLIGIGSALYGLVRSSAAQEVTNVQVSKDINDLKSAMVAMQTQTTSTASALASVTTATAASLAASTAALAAAVARDKKSSK